ncbi:hypothetical protein QQ045_011876 [Rhodiola kirilowii]
MGGGAAMRAAASRIIGAGAAVGGVGGLIRGSQSVPKPELQTFAAAKRTNSAIAASNEGVAVAAVDDWELAGVEEVSYGSGDSLPRVVFGGAPSFDEAKEATLELKAAVENSLLSESDANPGYKEASLPLLIGSEKSESITCVSSEVASTHVVTKHAVQAFRFLSETPAAQNVVASIASDPNVWTAVLQNTAFVDYLESHRAVASPPKAGVRSNQNQNLSLEELQDCYSESETSFAGSTKSNESGTTIADILQSLKLTMLDVVDKVSSFFQDLFKVPEADKKSTDDVCSSTSSFIESNTLKASVMGLAIMVISMVVLKRA